MDIRLVPVRMVQRTSVAACQGSLNFRRTSNLRGRGCSEEFDRESSLAEVRRLCSDKLLSRSGELPLPSERVERRLAAVLAADVAGYSRLMGKRGTNACTIKGAPKNACRSYYREPPRPHCQDHGRRDAGRIRKRS